MKTMLAVFLAGFFLVLSPIVRAEEMPVDDNAITSEEEYTEETNQEDLNAEDVSDDQVIDESMDQENVEMMQDETAPVE